MPSRTILEIMEPKDSLDDAAQNSGRVLDKGSPQTEKVSFSPPRRQRGHRDTRIKRSTGEDYRFARIRGLILFCVQVEICDPRPPGNALDEGRSMLHGSQPVDQLIFHGVEAGKDAIVESLFP
jgi:hypothetical protein